MIIIRLRPPSDPRGLLTTFLVTALSLAPVALHAQAQWTSNGVPLCTLPACYGDQPRICEDGAHGAIVAWHRGETVNDENPYVQRVLHGGAVAPGWPPGGTPVTLAPRNQFISDLVPDGAGGVFVAWGDPRNVFVTGVDLYLQHVLGNGQIAAGWPADGLPVCTLPGEQTLARLLPDGTGGVVMAWTDQRFSLSYLDEDIFAQHVLGDGTRAAGWPEGGLGICTAAGDQGLPVAVGDGQNGWYLVWQDYRNGFGEIFAQRLDWSGELAPGWPINGRRVLAASGSIWDVVPDGTGGAYIGWRSGIDPNLSDWEVYAIRMLSDGSIAPGWPAAGRLLTRGAGHQQLTGVVADGLGGVLLAWFDSVEQPAVALVQRLQADGSLAPGWPAGGARVSDVYGWHFAPHLAPDGYGGAYVVLEIQTDGNHGWMQHLTAGGTPAPGWPASGVPVVVPAIFHAFQQHDLEIVADGSGGAIVAWNDVRDGYGDQIYAQRFFGDGPTPVLVSLVSAEALPDRVALTWHDVGRTLALASVNRRREGEEWTALGSAPFDGTGRLHYEDHEVAPGVRYAYRLGWSEAGVEQFSAETWVVVPTSLVLALEGAQPNPAVGPLTVAFTLPRAEAATLELLDVSGRRIVARDVGSLGAGRHLIRLGECGCTPPGMYLLRLQQAGQALLKRAVLVR